MAKRTSLARSASASSASTMSCIQVAGSGTSSVSDHDNDDTAPSPTPPTSVTGDSAGDNASVKRESSVVSGQAAQAATETNATRRSVRSKLSVESYNLATLSDIQHAKAYDKLDGPRSFSGATLVNDLDSEAGAESSQAQQLRRQILEGQVEKALDMEWQIDDLEQSVPAEGSSTTAKRTKSAPLARVAKAAGRIKSALGKRNRDADNKAEDVDGSSVIAPTSKKARLMDTLTEMTNSLNRAVSVKKTNKKWLSQGLYCGQDPSFTGHLSDAKRLSKTEGAISTSETRRHMPYPMYSAGTREADFRLTYDLFAPLKKKENPKEWKKLSKNSFTPSAKEVWRTKKLERSVCLCPHNTSGKADGCGDDCLNRIMGYECDENNCAQDAGACSNRAFSELAKRTKDGNEYDIGVEIFKTKECGHGLRANRCFEPGQIIIEYCGEVITQEESDRRMNEIYKDRGIYYLMEFDQGMIIDATKGNIARFVNHSCAPNCLMEKRIVKGEPKMALFAGPAGVFTGQELSYDYNFDNFSALNALDCRCGAEFCRGKLMRRDAKKERENLAVSLKRKMEEAVRAATPEQPKEAAKKRKTARWSRGWAYIDPELEAIRLKEDAAEKGKDVDVRAVEILREATEKKDDRKVNIVLKEHGKRGASERAKEKMLERAASVRSSISRRSGSGREKRRSLLQRAGSLLRNTTSASAEPEEEEEVLQTIAVENAPVVDEEASPFGDEQEVVAEEEQKMSFEVEPVKASKEPKDKGKGKATKQSTLGFTSVNRKTPKAPKAPKVPKLEPLADDVDVLEMMFSSGGAAMRNSL